MDGRCRSAGVFGFRRILVQAWSESPMFWTRGDRGFGLGQPPGVAALPLAAHPLCWREAHQSLVLVGFIEHPGHRAKDAKRPSLHN